MEDNLLQKACPHWYREIEPAVESVMGTIEKRERCRICGYECWEITAPEPHPARDRDDVEKRLQQPGAKFVVTEWGESLEEVDPE